MLKQQDGRCFWCYRRVCINSTIDHIIPVSRGGTNARENLCLACKSCNSAKADLMPNDFVRHVLKVFHGFLTSDGFERFRRQS